MAREKRLYANMLLDIHHRIYYNKVERAAKMVDIVPIFTVRPEKI